MSRNDIGPEWNNDELDWLDDFLTGKKPAENSTPAPGSEPEPTVPSPEYIDFEKEPAEPASRPRREARAAAPERRRTESRAASPDRKRRESRAVPPERPRAESDRAPAYRRRRRRSTPMTIVIVILVLGIVFSAWQLGRMAFHYIKDRAAYSDLAESAVTQKPVTTVLPTEEDDPIATPFVSDIPIEVDWDMLRSINPDVVGWLYCPGTIINYPVVQAANNEFYLNHGFDQSSNNAGALFVDMDSALGITQSNYIIYGHNMKDNSMFGTIKDYMDEDYLAENPFMYYLTPYASYRVDLFGIHIVEGTIDNYPVYFGDTAAYQDYIDRISTGFYWFKRDIQTTQYQLMTLSTCTSASGYSDARLVLHGVMVPIQ